MYEQSILTGSHSHIDWNWAWLCIFTAAEHDNYIYACVCIQFMVDVIYEMLLFDTNTRKMGKHTCTQLLMMCG